MNLIQLTWQTLYREAELYKAAVRLYTRPLFNGRKALSTSTDGHTLLDFARHGLARLDGLHRALLQQRFHYRPGLALHHNFNGKLRTLYVYPWEERLVDLLLYRLLNQSLHAWLSPHAYAYRDRTYGLDRCQRRIGRRLTLDGQPLFVFKRDILNYFASVDHDVLEAQLAGLVPPADYLSTLLHERIRFSYQEGREVVTASRGIPFGTAIAALLANVYLTPMDRRLAAIPELSLFRYGDDILAVSSSHDSIQRADDVFEDEMARLKLQSKASHHLDLVFDEGSRLRHLGLEFRADGTVGLSRDKFRKLRNLFRFAFRRYRSRLSRLDSVEARARLAIQVAQQTVTGSVRNVAIIDYYLRHVNDEAQLKRLDRWLAEEVLSIACGGGHRQGHFRHLSFARLRSLGLPSLLHRGRLIRHGHIESPFFAWMQHQAHQVSRGTTARPQGLLPVPRSSGCNHPVGEGIHLSMGVIEVHEAKACGRLPGGSPGTS